MTREQAVAWIVRRSGKPFALGETYIARMDSLEEWLRERLVSFPSDAAQLLLWLHELEYHVKPVLEVK